MNYEIYELTKKQIQEIYETWLVIHFPADEVKPLKNILRMYEDGAYRCVGMFLADQLVSYAFFTIAPECDMVLLDYFAVLPDSRSQGAGSIFLAKMKELFPEHQGILIETEDIAAARNEAEINERRRRNLFYERAGVHDMEFVTNVYGVHYMIWSYPFAEDADLNEETCRKNLQKIYQLMIPGEKYEKFVQI